MYLIFFYFISLFTLRNCSDFNSDVSSIIRNCSEDQYEEIESFNYSEANGLVSNFLSEYVLFYFGSDETIGELGSSSDDNNEESVDERPFKQARIDETSTSTSSNEMNFDNVHGSADSHLLLIDQKFNKKTYLKRKPSEPKILIDEIRAKFYEQFPEDEEFSFLAYKIENWPEGVNQFSTRWPNSHIEIIRSRLSTFKFFKRESYLSILNDLGLNKFIKFPHGNRRARTEIVNELMNRFKEESGWKDGKSIDWRQLDRRDIPSGYDGLIINSRSLSSPRVFNNSEVIDNIHFKPYTEEELAKKKENLIAYNRNKLQKQVTIESLDEDEEYKRAHERILEIFRADTGNSEAKSINWRRVNKSLLPEKYKDAHITNKLLYQLGYYKDPEFLENVHFKNYRKSYLYRCNFRRSATANL